MAISFVNSAIPAGNPTTSFTVTIPTVAVDDLLILHCTNRDADTAPTVADDDTGGNTWTNKTGASSKTTLWYKYATSGTSAKTITASGFTGSSAGVLIVLRGTIGTGDPFDHQSREVNGGAAATEHAGFTPTTNGCWIGLAVSNVNNDHSVTSSACTDPGSLADGNEKLSPGGSDCASSLRGALQVTAAATGTFTWSQTSGANQSEVFAILPPNAITLTADPGTYSLTGTAALLEIGYKVAANAGSYSLTGTAASLKIGYRLDAGVGSYSLTGADATLFKSIPLIAAPGTYTLTGTAAALLYNRLLSAAAGSYSLTGTDAELSRQVILVAVPGTYSLTGTNASLERGLLLSAGLGSYSLTGTDAVLSLIKAIQADPGNYLLTGTAASLRHAVILIAAPGLYILDGTSAALLAPGDTPGAGSGWMGLIKRRRIHRGF